MLLLGLFQYTTVNKRRCPETADCKCHYQQNQQSYQVQCAEIASPC